MTRHSHARPLTLLSAVILAFGLPQRPAAAQVDDRPPNIVLILADDLGYADLGSYGQARIATPRLDRMAAEGMRFTRFYAGSTVCAPSRSVLMTGQHTGHTRVRGNGARELQTLQADDFTVAELLQGRGYRTGLIGKWGLGEADQPGRPSAHGFDFSFGYLNQTHAHNYYPAYLFRNEERVPLRNEVRELGRAPGAGVATRRIDYSHDLFAAEALDFVSDNRDRPFFLYLALTIPHANNEAGRPEAGAPPERGMEVPDFGRYAEEEWPATEKGFAAMISRMDADVGRLLDRLRELGIAERTLVIFSSDNGPHAEGGHDPDFFDSNGPLRGIKRDLYEGGIRVPTIAWWPGRVAAGTTSDHVAWFADFLPTVAELTGAPVPPETDGIGFLPTLLGRPAEQREHTYLYWEFYEGGSAQAVLAGRWKGVRTPMHGGALELYDLQADPGETTDVAAAHPDVVRRLESYMKQAHVPAPEWQAARAGGGRDVLTAASRR